MTEPQAENDAPDYADLVATSRRAGISDRPRPCVYVLHQATCSRVGSNALPLTEYGIGPEAILRKVRHSLNAKACSYCEPDPARRVIPPEGIGLDHDLPTETSR